MTMTTYPADPCQRGFELAGGLAPDRPPRAAVEVRTWTPSTRARSHKGLVASITGAPA
jgi:hypothetical protein